MKLIIKLALIAILGLSSGMIMASANQKSAQEAISAAQQAQKKAASVKGEWRDTGKIIKKAQQSMKKGDFDKAVKLANKAERQGNYGYEQAVSQKTLKMPSYLKH